MKAKQLVFLFLALCITFTSADDSSDKDKTFCQMVNARNLLCEEHSATTSDGYILKLFRIPGSLSDPVTNGKPVVFLMHGLIDSSDTWIFNTQENAIGTWLAQQGYDVWLGNSRGNKYTKQHTSLPTNWWDKEFWSFAWMQMSQYDVPTNIEYVLQATGQSQISYIGHSQGTTQMFAALSDPEIAPKIQDHIKVFISVAPVIYEGHIETAFMQTLAKLYVGELIYDAHIYEFLSLDPSLSKALAAFCNLLTLLCEGIDKIFADLDPTINDWDRVPVILAHEPAGTSTMDMIQWAQAVRTNKFQKYDYGANKNKEIYGQETPPQYDLSKIKVPLAWFYGGKDLVSNPVDVERAISELNQVNPGILKFVKKLPDYGHMSFVWAGNANSAYFQDLLSTLNQYNSNSAQIQKNFLEVS